MDARPIEGGSRLFFWFFLRDLFLFCFSDRLLGVLKRCLRSFKLVFLLFVSDFCSIFVWDSSFDFFCFSCFFGWVGGLRKAGRMSTIGAQVV